MVRALVVYESLWGNTEKVAHAVAEALRTANAEVTIIVGRRPYND